MENKYSIGIEVEKLRCTKDGKLSKEKHPKKFGNKMTNNFITTDFGEAQMELRTSVCDSTEDCYTKLEAVTNVVLDVLNQNNQLFWPYSMPCILPKEEDFLFGDYENYPEEKEYEMALYKKYGYKMHNMSGVHVNFSIDKKFLKEIRKIYKNVPATIDEVYLKIIKTFLNKAWMLIYFFGATPIECEGKKNSKLSIRNSSKSGFSNRGGLKVDLSSRQNYAKSVEENVKAGNILSVREVYLPIRPKAKGKDDLIKDFMEKEINHIEVRLCDLNPFDKCGFSKSDMDFTIAFLFYCLIDETEFTLDYKEVAENGITEKQRLKLLKELEKFIEINKKLDLELDEGINEKYHDCKVNETRADKVLKLCEKDGLVKSMIKLAEEYAEDGDKNKYIIRQYPDLEASTVVLLKAAILHGIDFKIINEATSFVQLIDGKHKEYVVQATKTNKDSYIFPYVTDDKYFAKKLMKENGLEVSEGIMIDKNMSEEKINKLITPYIGKPVAIKPRTTNFGVGITVFKKPVTEKRFKNAIQYAFRFGNNVLIENYVKGREYRFVVIDGKCVSVIWRRSASVVGNGVNTIHELIEMKNRESWHFLLRHEVVIDEVAKKFLLAQGLDLESIPAKDERIFLRENSNCSTGGESVGMTEVMPERFKRIAEKASRVFKGKICGVDIIIDDLDLAEYKIIEINDNPGLSSSEWPYEGDGKSVGAKLLELLGFIKKEE